MRYEEVPKGLTQNLEFRNFLCAEAAKSESLQKDLIQTCKDDILFYFNTFVWTYDPRLETTSVPFITYGYQDETLMALLEVIRGGKKFLMQKSRDMGASWMCDGIFDHQAQFEKGRKFLMLSRNAELVDNSDNADSLFWKIDFIHQHLPKWMLDTGKKGTLSRKRMRASYLKTGSQLSGATTTKASGVGGRATAVFVDEFSRFDPFVARMIKSGLADVSNCIIYNFTPSPEMGKAHPSYELVEQYKKKHIEGVVMHWRRHPEKARGLYRVDPETRIIEVIDKSYKFPPDYPWQKDGVFEWHSPWFDKERIERGNDRDVKEMLEIDYDGSGFSVFDHEMIKNYIADCCRPTTLEASLDFDRDGKPSRLVKVEGGLIKLWFPIDGMGKVVCKVPCVAGVDASLGVGETPSVLSIYRIDTGEKVLQVTTAEMSPKEFAVYVVAICRWLSVPSADVLLCWERNGPGDTFGDEVIRLGYTSIYYAKDTQKFASRPSPKAGLCPQNSSKMMWLTKYQSALGTRSMINYSIYAMEECFGWKYKDGVPSHPNTLAKSDDPSKAKKNHGDHVIADAICAVLLEDRKAGSIEAKKKSLPKDAYDMVMEMVRGERVDESKMFADWDRHLWR